MDSSNQNFQRKVSANADRRSKSPLGWTIGAAFLAVLLGLLIIYLGFTDQFNEATKPSSSTTPNAATDSSPSK
jgi:hypothetical protein